MVAYAYIYKHGMLRVVKRLYLIYIPEQADHGVVDALKHVAFTV